MSEKQQNPSLILLMKNRNCIWKSHKTYHNSIKLLKHFEMMKILLNAIVKIPRLIYNAIM